MKQFRKTGMIFLVIILTAASLQSQEKWNTATSNDESYNWPMIGNGELQTIVGPNGYHNGKVLEVESVNRTLFWAGRRHKDARTAETWIPRFDKDIPIGSTQPLVRFGRTIRKLIINGTEATDDHWIQTMDYDRGIVKSTLNHTLLREYTESMILLDQNIIVFHTILTNTSNSDVSADLPSNMNLVMLTGNRLKGPNYLFSDPIIPISFSEAWMGNSARTRMLNPVHLIFRRD